MLQSISNCQSSPSEDSGRSSISGVRNFVGIFLSFAARSILQIVVHYEFQFSLRHTKHLSESTVHFVDYTLGVDRVRFVIFDLVTLLRRDRLSLCMFGQTSHQLGGYVTSLRPIPF